MEQRDDILQTAGLAVDEVFAVAVAVETAGHCDVRRIQLENVIGIVENQRHLAKGQRFSLQRAAENDILHIGAAQRLSRLLAQHPAHGVGHVAFAAAVGAYDAGHALVEADRSFFGKRFESDKLYFF